MLGSANLGPSIFGCKFLCDVICGHKKTGNSYRIRKKFAANIPYVIGSLCSKFGNSWFIFKEVTTKDRWTQVRGPEHSRPPSVLNLRGLWSNALLNSDKTSRCGHCRGDISRQSDTSRTFIIRASTCVGRTSPARDRQ